MYQLQEYLTKQKVNPNGFVFTGDPTTPWEVSMDLEEVRRKLNLPYFRETPPSISKYLPFMPIEKYSEFVSLKEGATPLLKSQHIGHRLGIDLYFKLESQNPTGSFKDRGSALELSVAKEMNVAGICVASTGNMAASCACYAASAGIPCYVFIPEGTPASKLAQTISYGGKILQVKGTYNDAAKLAEKVAGELGFYLAGDYAFRIEGAKTAAFEVIDQLFFQTPDKVICPMGCGTNIASYAKGFAEYQFLGLIDRLPQLIGAQADGAASIVKSFEKHSMNIDPLLSLHTIASAIAVTYPLDGVKALDGIYKSEGCAVSVSDNEILESQHEMARCEGIFVEPSSATALAVLKKLAKTQDIRGQKIVCVLTGDGLKDTAPILKVAIKPPVIEPTVKDFLTLYDNKYFSGSTISIVEQDEVLFVATPTIAECKQSVTTFFGTTFSDEKIALLCETIAAFLQKGKSVTRTDLQDIIQDALKSSRDKKERYFKVEDFSVVTAKDKKPTATVEISMGTTRYSASGEGVGPVDAVINALRRACKDEMPFALEAYSVEIRSQGTDAVVSAEMTLTSQDKNAIGQAASPDVIQASIMAFERAYNGLID